MKKGVVGFTLLSVIISMQLAGLALASSQQTLTASVNVICPFTIAPNVLAAFEWGGGALLNYSATANVLCTVPSMSGYVGLYYSSNSVLAYKSGISLDSVTYNAVTNGNFLFDTTQVSAGNYIVDLNLTTFGEIVSANAPVDFVPAALIKIASASTGSPVSAGSPLVFQINYQNSGGLASNQITLHVNITGPSTNSFITYNELGLSPGQSANQTGSLFGYTNLQGTYNVTVYGVYNGNRITNAVTTHYTVTSASSSPVFGTGGTPVGPSSVSLVNIASVSMIYAPLYTSLSAGSEASAPLVLQNSGPLPEMIRLSLPRAYGNVSSLSVSALALSPGQSLSSTLLFSPPPGTPAGTYVIPVNISVRVNNVTINRTVQDFIFYVYSANQTFSSVMNQVSLLQNGTIAQGDVQTTAYIGLKNATLRTLLPLSVAQSKADISAYGVPSNISIQNGYYVITWFISNLSSNNSAIAYYQIKNPNPAILGLHIQNILTEQSAVSSGDLLKSVNFALPAFYVNSTNQLSVDVLYTGSASQDVYFYLTGSPGVPIENSSRIIKANPNQLLEPKFNVLTNSSTGTIILYAYVITKGANITYTLPISITNRQGQLSQIGQFGGTLRSTVLLNPYTYIVGLAIIGVTMMVFARGRIGREKYSRERANKLVMMRERIKREMDEHG